MTVLHEPARRAFYRSRLLRELAAVARWPGLRKDAPDLAHLVNLTERMGGPVQRDEALLLHSLVRVVRPRIVVEIGFFHGHSAFNFLRALDPDARLYSFDVNPVCADIARKRFGHDERFVFRLRSQTELTSKDVDGHLADLVSLDAAHQLELNQATFGRLLPLMASGAIFAVHDTGTVPRASSIRVTGRTASRRAGWATSMKSSRTSERSRTGSSIPTPSSRSSTSLAADQPLRAHAP